jgi:hypothetical protein
MIFKSFFFFVLSNGSAPQRFTLPSFDNGELDARSQGVTSTRLPDFLPRPFGKAKCLARPIFIGISRDRSGEINDLTTCS